MDEKLIEYVRKNDALYDLSHRRYSDNQYKTNAWMSIREKLQLELLQMWEEDETYEEHDEEDELTLEREMDSKSEQDCGEKIAKLPNFIEKDGTTK
ncbi:hypothetical protein FQA39_LY07845 [Lamprigera yunnana]|nr:hypothetical protein FQA39_LY07845 [Lamprigera yunnana]